MSRRLHAWLDCPGLAAGVLPPAVHKQGVDGQAQKHVAVIGGGPAGLMAAETMAEAGLAVTVFERKANSGRKFLLAGRGGLNLTHSEILADFCTRYGAASGWMAPHLAAFPPAALRGWAEDLGQETFIGSSGRVFPKAMKASPLLRAWLARLGGLGVRFVTRAEWMGWDEAGALRFADGQTFAAAAVVLALGGASWPQLGADGGWVSLLPGVQISPLRPANCGFLVPWSAHFAQRFAGQPLKRVVARCGGQSVAGEMMITACGIEGGAVYALAAVAREMIEDQGHAEMILDLRPDMAEAALAARLAGAGRDSLSTALRKRAGLGPVAIGLVQEVLHNGVRAPLAALIKNLPLRLTATSGLARAISTAGGIALDELDENLMLRRRPGVFVAGEMLDWEAPTGGYLLQGCLATGRAAGSGVRRYLAG